MYNNRMRNIELPENLFSNLGEMKSKQLEKKREFSIESDSYDVPENPITSDYQPPLQPNVKLTNYSSKKEYRDRIDKMYEEIKGIIPIDNEIDPVLYFNNYVEKGIVVKPKVPSLKQCWTEYRLISNEKRQTTQPHPQLKTTLEKRETKEADSFDELFAALSTRVSEINSYIDELKNMKNSIEATTKKLENDKARLATERSEFNTYKQKEESKLNKEKESLKINFNRLQTIIDDLDKKLVSLDIEE